MASSKEILAKLWQPPQKPLVNGAWLWWFWIFFIHDDSTPKTGRCRQIMILWSVKNDQQIDCNNLDIRAGAPITPHGDDFKLDGAAAAWYFDGRQMHEDFVLHRSQMTLDPDAKKLDAPKASTAPSSGAQGTAGTSSSFFQKGDDFITTISTPAISFELVARQTDRHPAVGPVYGRTSMGAGMEIEGTRLERLDLSGWEKGKDGKKKKIKGTAYFQKILLAAPPPCWYWGLYHFEDGSIATYMQVYAGRASLAANLWPHERLRTPHVSLKEDILVYHAATGRVFEGHHFKVHPTRLDGAKGAPNSPALWRHTFEGEGPGFSITGHADAYSHACWTFRKSIGALPLRSTFQYNEYPSVLRELRIVPTDGSKPMVLKNGWGNMENAWGFLI